MRNRLPPRRPSENENFLFNNVEVAATFGYNEYGVAEVFLSTRKAGTPFDVACRDIAVLISLLLQYGCPLEEIASAVTHDGDGRREGLAGHVIDKMLDRRVE